MSESIKTIVLSMDFSSAKNQVHHPRLTVYLVSKDYGNFVKLLNFYSGKGSENRYETLWDGACSHA